VNKRPTNAADPGLDEGKRAARPRNSCEAPASRPPGLPSEPTDRAAAWLRFAGVAVGLVAVAAAAVSYEAQWRLVYADKHELGVSYIQAAIPDLGSLVFACFGIALALHGKRAIRARLLNVLCVGISIAMNVLAATGGWAGLAVWVMSPVIYALASDTLIGVVRAYVIARQKRLRETLADGGGTPLQIVGAVLLWLLRLVWAPPSTIKGFHRWVKSLPAAPAVRQQTPPDPRPAIPNSRGPRHGTKQEQFLTLAIARYGTAPVHRGCERGRPSASDNWSAASPARPRCVAYRLGRWCSREAVQQKSTAIRPVHLGTSRHT